MSYTLVFTLLDLGGLYSAGLPTLSGVLNVPTAGGPVGATGTVSPFSITFPTLSNPPGAPGTLLVADPSGPGDYFRSGTVSSWPAEPASVFAGAAMVRLSYAAIAAGIPKPSTIGVPWYVAAAIGAATGSNFIPFNITLNTLAIGPSSTPGALRARFSGTIGFFTLVIPRRTAVTGSVDLTLTPSGDAATPANVVAVATSNLSLSPSSITPLSTSLLALLAPLFSGALAGPLTTVVNSAIATEIGSARAMLPLSSSGAPLFSAAATVSIRRISALRSGLLIHAILAELVASPPLGTGGGTGSEGTDEEQRFDVSIDPPPQLDTPATYVVRVRRRADMSSVEDATVTIVTYLQPSGNGVAITGQTNAQGLVALDAILSPRARPSVDPTHTGQLKVTWPSLTVKKAAFVDHWEELGP